jgi:hypothetical protein
MNDEITIDLEDSSHTVPRDRVLVALRDALRADDGTIYEHTFADGSTLRIEVVDDR